MAEILSLTTIDLFGGSRTILARIKYEGQDAEVSLTGRQKGPPRLVRVQVKGIEVPVPFPAQYGDQFNEDWVRKYLEKNIKEEA